MARLLQSFEQAATVRPHVDVWDTEYFPRRQVLDIFNEGVRKACMPWSNDFKSGSEFAARVESRIHASGTITQVSVSPHIAQRTSLDISMSSAECVYVLLVRGGAIDVQTAHGRSVADKDDIILYRSDAPIVMTHERDASHRVLVLVLPIRAVHGLFGNGQEHIVIRRDRMPRPLMSCLLHLSRCFGAANDKELNSIIDAVVSLLALVLERDDADGEPAGRISSQSCAKLLKFVHDNIRNPELSPTFAAREFGVSTRYVHKIFGGMDETFSAYVGRKRLENIKNDLSAAGEWSSSMSNLAQCWGFASITTFNRSFKRQFGCTPKEYRAKF